MKPRGRGPAPLPDRPTTEPCPNCMGIAVTGEVCLVCFGKGVVTIARGDRWRVANGIAPKRGPLPRPTPPRRR